MIYINAFFDIKKEEKDNFIQLAKEVVKETRKEDGCVAYDSFENSYEDNHIVFIEIWKDEISIENHKKTKHFQDFVSAIGGLLNKDLEVRVMKEL